MYKARLKHWKLKKYFSARDKEAVAQLLESYRREGLEAPDITLNGTHVPLHVIRRHCRQHRIFNDMSNKLPYLPESSTESTEIGKVAGDDCDTTDLASPGPAGPSSPLVLRWQTSPPPTSPVFITTGLEVVQNIVMLTSQYYHWHLGSDLTEEQFEVSSRPSAVPLGQFIRMALNARTFWASFSRGLDLLDVHVKPFARSSKLLDDRARHEAWEAFSEGCELAGAVLGEQHRGLLKLICLLFSDHRWGQFPELRAALFRYFSGMSTKLLGERHPLSIILRLCKNPVVFRNSSQIMLKVILDVSAAHLCGTTAEIGQLERASCDVLRLNGEYADAESMAKTLVKKCEALHGRNNEETRRALRRLAHIYIDQGRNDLAEQVYHDVIERGKEELGDDFPDDSCVFAYQNLAKIAIHRGDNFGAQVFWKHAHDGAVYQFGFDDNESCYCRQQIEALTSGRTNVDLVHPNPGGDSSAYLRKKMERAPCDSREYCANGYGLISPTWTVGRQME